MTRPTASSPPTQSQSRSSGPNVILYLPPGPLFQGLGTTSIHGNGFSDFQVQSHSKRETGTANSTATSPQHILASATSATVVTINYRLGRQSSPAISPEETVSDHESASNPSQALSTTGTPADFYKYPYPVHDTLAGFDWIQTHLKPAHLGVFGSHIGGSLALMLALTEAQSVHAVAAVEPVTDWPGLDEYCAIEDSAGTETATNGDNSSTQDQAPTTTTTTKPKRPSKKKISRTPAPPDLVPLLEARELFFSSPERCFDAFASPILFLRSAGRDIPRTFPRYLTGPEYPVPLLKKPRKTTAAEHQAAPDGSPWDSDIYPDIDADENDQLDVSASGIRRRKALSRWPPHGLDYGLSGQTWSGLGDGVGRLQVTLPWVRVFLQDHTFGGSGSLSGSTTKHKDGETMSTVLGRQGEEMVSAMRRACFWGREKGVGERRVTLSRGDEESVGEAGGWFSSVFDGSLKDD